MDSEQAFAAFANAASSSASERLRAARFLARHATPAHQTRLSKIRGTESNSWVRQALDQALKRAELGGPVATIADVEEVQETPFLNGRLTEELRAQAIGETSAMFLHELRPLIGLLDVAAASDIYRYACSSTKASVSRIQSFLDVIDRLREASAAPAILEFDLTDLVSRVVGDEAAKGRVTTDKAVEGDTDAFAEGDAEQAVQQPVVRLSLARREPIVTTGDPTLVGMALTNALRNAIEAVLEIGESEHGNVIINWGITDTDNWIVVLDEGCGLPSGWDHLTEPGISTKSKDQGHLGMGLTIARRAMESTRGVFRLTPRPGAGVSCEIRWPREGKQR